MSSSPSGKEKIDFGCEKCGQRLSVAAEYAGAQVQCPACQSIQTASTSSMASNRGQPPVVRPSPSTGVSAQPGSSSSATRSSDDRAAHGAEAPQTSVPFSNPGPNSILHPGSFEGQSPALNVPVIQSEFAPSEPEIGSETRTRKMYEKIRKEVAKVYVGQDELVMGTLVALFSGGHVLIESVPGLGKTLFVRTLGKILGCQFGRIQFTADLMPSDITGAPIFNIKTQEFSFRAGPVFTQLLLADEINRAPAKTHAALLEIMQEYRVTVDGTTHGLKRPFIVLATQNPVESEGTYNLPEAQLDRFMFKLIADYPSVNEEAEILMMHSLHQKPGAELENQLDQVTNPEEILSITEETDRVRVDPKLVDYINSLVRLTRNWPQFYIGASPRAGIGLMQASRTLAAFYGRDYTVPDDVVQIALPALRHRVILTAEAEVEGQNVDQILTDLIRSVEVPRLR